MFEMVTLHLSLKPCLDMTSFGKNLLFIAMTHVGVPEGYVQLPKIAMTYLLRYVWESTLPPSNMFGHVPPVNKPCQDMTSFGNTFYCTQRWVTIAKAVWRHLVTLLRRRDSSFISMTYFKACSNRIPPKINVKAVTLNTVKYFLHYFWFVFSFKFFFLIYKSIKNCQI